MPNNKKIGNQTGSVPLPSVSSSPGSWVAPTEVNRFRSLNKWPLTPRGLVGTVGDYFFATSSGTVAVASGTYDFLPAYGNEVLISSYPDLFNVIGAHYGGDGVTLFKTPNVQGLYGYLKGANTPSGVYSSGNLPLHTHLIGGADLYGGITNLTPQQYNVTNPPYYNTSTDGSSTNEGTYKEIVPLINTLPSCPIPVGCAVQFMLPTSTSTLASLLPQGVLVASGQELSRTAYPLLFERLGVYYGSGDGSTTFNIPDYRGVFLRAPFVSTNKVQPEALITGSGYAPSSFASHYHTAPATNTNPPNIVNSQSYPAGTPISFDDTTITSPASGPANIGSAESRPRNFACLTCIVASGTI